MDALTPKTAEKSPSHGPIGIHRNASLTVWLGILQTALKRVFALNLQYLLLMLTMAIGAFLLSTTQFAGEGALRLFQKDEDHAMGNRVVVYPDPGPNQNLLDRRSTEKLTLQDLNFVQRHLSDVRYVSPAYYGRSLVTARANDRYMQVDGISRKMESESMYQPIDGNGFSEIARNGLVLECLLTKSAARALDIDLNKQPYLLVETFRLRVTGIIADQSHPGVPSENKMVVPFMTAQMLWGKPDQIDHIVVAWDHADEMKSIISRLQRALDTCRAPGAYYLSCANANTKNRRNLASGYIVFGNVQAIFCILVAIVGILNAMLAGLIRRGQEYAIRVVMGAKKMDIVILMLLESGLLGLVGATLGVFAAVVTANPACRLIASFIPEAKDLLPIISIDGVLLPLLICTMGGFIAGLLPAVRARRLDILSILRRE